MDYTASCVIAPCAFCANERGRAMGEAETSTPDPNVEDPCGFNSGENGSRNFDANLYPQPLQRAMKMHEFLLGRPGYAVSYDADLFGLVLRSPDSFARGRRKQVVLLLSCRVHEELKYASDRHTLPFLGHRQFWILDDIFPDELLQNFSRAFSRRFDGQEGGTCYVRG